MSERTKRLPVSIIEFNCTVANLSVAEEALREEPYPRLPYLSGQIALTISVLERLRQEGSELLEACEALITAMRDYEIDVDDPPTEEHRAMMVRAREAVAKAKGEA